MVRRSDNSREARGNRQTDRAADGRVERGHQASGADVPEAVASPGGNNGERHGRAASASASERRGSASTAAAARGADAGSAAADDAGGKCRHRDGVVVRGGARGTRAAGGAGARLRNRGERGAESATRRAQVAQRID